MKDFSVQDLHGYSTLKVQDQLTEYIYSLVAHAKLKRDPGNNCYT